MNLLFYHILIEQLPGGIVSSIKDLYLWDQAFYNGKIGGKKLIDQMHKKGRLNNSKEITYAFGIGVRKVNNIKVVSHSGGWEGFRTYIGRCPDYKLSLILLSNDPRIMGKTLPLLKKEVVNQFIPNGKEKKKGSPPEIITLTDKKLKKYTGTYLYSKGNYARKIYLKDNSLYYYRGKNNISKMIPIREDLFTFEKDTGIRIHFRKPDNSNEFKMHFTDTDNTKTEAVRYAPFKKDSDNELKNYAGHYFFYTMYFYRGVIYKNGSLYWTFSDSKKSNMKSIIKNNEIIQISKNDYAWKTNYNLVFKLHKEKNKNLRINVFENKHLQPSVKVNSSAARKDVKNLTGKYYSGKDLKMIDVKIKDNKLFIKGIPKYTKHFTFVNKNLFLYSDTYNIFLKVSYGKKKDDISIKCVHGHISRGGGVFYEVFTDFKKM